MGAEYAWVQIFQLKESTSCGITTKSQNNLQCYHNFNCTEILKNIE